MAGVRENGIIYMNQAFSPAYDLVFLYIKFDARLPLGGQETEPFLVRDSPQNQISNRMEAAEKRLELAIID